MLEAVRWYLALTVVGAGGLLPALLLFDRLRSGGVLFARPLALLSVAYVAWIVSWAGVAPYGTGLVLAAAALLWLWSAALGWRRPELLRALWRRRSMVLVGEALFIALFALIVIVRAQAPDALNTEKPMDLMVLSAVREADALPPLDPWFAGERLSYYHLGHTGVDAIARLARVGTGTAFTLGLAAAGAMAGAAVFALAGDAAALSLLRRRSSPWVAGAVATASLLFLATLEGPIELLAANGIGGEAAWAWIGINGLPGPAAATDAVPDQFWWWWRATRVLPGTITEFPAFSLILGDLHAHVLALPLAPPMIALALLAFDGAAPLTWRSWLRRPGALLLAALLLAGLVMTHSWDAALYGGLWLAAVLWAFVAVGWDPVGAAVGAVRYMAFPVGLALLASAPFIVSLDSSVGLDLVTGAASDPVRFSIVWLPLLVPIAAAVLLLRPRLRRGSAAGGVALVALLPVGWATVALVTGRGEALADRGSGWIVLVALVLASGTAGAAAAAAHRDGERGRAAWLALAAAVAVLVLATELVRVTDVFDNRLNTVFKFWFGGWLVLAVAGGAAVATALDRLRRPPLGRIALPVLALGAVVYGSSLLYAPAAAVSRAREGQQRGLDALAYLDRADPGQAAALRWVEANLDPSQTLLEAVGRAYTSASFLSAASGVPTLLGWPGHERQWRDRPEEIANRAAAVARIYGDGASEETLVLATAYGVTHVYLGREEREQYGDDVAERFAAWPTLFEGSGSSIVEVPR